MPPAAVNLFNHVHDDAEIEVHLIKDKYKRQRPFVRDTSLKPCIKLEPSLSYPSGHSTLAHIYAYVLSDLMPSHRKEFFFRADEAAMDRVIGGVHHPSDIRAGASLADQLHTAMVQSDRYQADLKKAQAELKP